MSHTLHRRGKSEDLKRDVIVFCMSAKTVNGDGSAPKKQKFFEIVSKYPYANFGDVKTGSQFNSDWDTVRDSFKDQSVPHFVFTDYDVAASVLKELAEADLGISVVVSGVMDGIVEMCRTSGLKIHTSEHSAGILGKTEKLPDEPILEITTMCGHALVARQFGPRDGPRGEKGQEDRGRGRSRTGQTVHVRSLQPEAGRTSTCAYSFESDSNRDGL